MNVFPFSESLAAVQDVPIATVITIWENPANGEQWILVIHEALYFGTKLKDSLLCPNQLRAAGVQVKDAPIQFDAASSHSVSVPGKLDIPLEMHGVISYLQTRLPTNDEIERYRAGQFQSVELTEDIPWEPYSNKFAEREVAARAQRKTSAVRVTSPHPKHVTKLTNEAEERTNPRRLWNRIGEERCIAVVSRLALSMEPIELSDEMDLADRLIAAINTTATDTNGDGLAERPDDSLCTTTDEDRLVFAMSTKDRGPVITKEILAKRWGIGLDTAHRTLTSTTQVGIRRVLHPVERRYKTKQSHLRFPTLNTRFYTDTMFSTSKSLRGNKVAQVFTNGNGYDLFYPLAKEADAADALTEVIRTIGIPKELISDGAKAETQGKFGKVIKEYKIKQRISEPYSGWQNRAEAAIREIKRGINRATLRARSPKRIWDYCGE